MAEEHHFDAFLSYSHSRDRSLAKSLQRSMERWGTAVPGRRTLRVFRDESNLAAHPDLWEIIRGNLERSRFFILMASPESARSPWVAREVAHFAKKDPQALRRFAVVLTAGTLPWLEDDPAPDQVAMAPEVLALFPQEPLVVDLRSFREAKANPELAGRVATLVAAILEKEKDEVFGEHLKAQRRFIASLVSGILALGLAIVLALLQTKRANEQTALAKKEEGRANSQAEVAQKQRELAVERAAEALRQKGRADREAEAAKRQAQRADEQTVLATQQAQRADTRAREATSRRLAGQVDRLAEARTDTALLLMAQAFRMADNSAIRSSWWRALGSPDLPRAFLPVGAKSVRFEADGSLWAELAGGAATFKEGEDGAWSKVRAVPTSTAPEDTWDWSGSCEDDTPVCACSQWESRRIGPYGDSDSFCIASTLKVPGWCSDQALEVPGVQLQVWRTSSSVRVETEFGRGEYACVEPPPSAGKPPTASGIPALVSGSPKFFAGRTHFDRILAIGPRSIGAAQSYGAKRLAVLRADGGIEVWEGERGPARAERWGISRLELPARGLALAGSGEAGSVVVATAATDEKGQGGLVLWRSLDLAHAPRPPGDSFPGAWNEHRGPAGAFALSRDGTLLAGGVAVDIPIWRTTSLGAPLRKLRIGRNAVTSVEFSPDGSYLVAVLLPNDKTLPSVTVFSVDDGMEMGSFGSGERGACFHPSDSDTVVTAGDAGVKLWQRRRNGKGGILLPEPAVAIAADPLRGRLAVGLADGDVAIWEALDGRPPIRSGRRVGKAVSLSFLPGVDALLWVSERGLEAWYWREDTWFRISEAPHRAGLVLRDGSVLGLTKEGQAWVYDLDPARWQLQTCGLVGRNLKRSEWDTYLGTAFPYECTCPGYGPGEGAPAAACARE